jgi:hypothetical protein
MSVLGVMNKNNKINQSDCVGLRKYEKVSTLEL